MSFVKLPIIETIKNTYKSALFVATQFPSLILCEVVIFFIYSYYKQNNGYDDFKIDFIEHAFIEFLRVTVITMINFIIIRFLILGNKSFNILSIIKEKGFKIAVAFYLLIEIIIYNAFYLLKLDDENTVKLVLCMMLLVIIIWLLVSFFAINCFFAIENTDNQKNPIHKILNISKNNALNIFILGIIVSIPLVMINVMVINISDYSFHNLIVQTISSLFEELLLLCAAIQIYITLKPNAEIPPHSPPV